MILLVPPIVAPILVTGYNEFSGTRAKRNEEAAVKALRTIASANARFRERDRDNDNILDYATNLAELRQAGLIDNRLADGLFEGYTFGLSGSTFDWLATATPVSRWSGNRNLIICTDGVVRFSSTRSASCSFPVGYQ